MQLGGETVLGIQMGTLAAAAAILALVGIADAVLRWIVRRKVRRDEVAAADATASHREVLHWLDRGLTAAVPPLALLIWVVGGYLALSTRHTNLQIALARSPR